MSLGAVAIAIGTAACTPPPAALPSCPARQEVQLEPADPVTFSLPRAVSSNGRWILISRAIDGQLVVSVRTAVTGSAPTVVGEMPQSAFTSSPPWASVADDGTSAAFGVAGGPLYRWERGTGAAEAVAAPAVVDPPPGVPSPAHLADLSTDGRRAMWVQGFFVDETAGQPYSWSYVLSVTDIASAAIVLQRPVDLADTSPAMSTGGSTLTTRTDLIDVDSGVMAPLAPAVAQLLDEYPVAPFAPVNSSDNGRFTLFMRIDDGTGGINMVTYVVYDHASGSWSEVARATDLIGVELVADDGAVVYVRGDAPAISILARAADGTRHQVVSTVLNPTYPVIDPRRPLTHHWAMTSSDGRTVLYSAQVPVLGSRLTASRCS